MASYSERGHSGPATAPELAEARTNVVDALGRMERGERNALDALRGVLCTFVGVLRSEGATRQQAIESVRGVVSQPATPDGVSRLLPSAREALIELSTYWCAEEFGRG